MGTKASRKPKGKLTKNKKTAAMISKSKTVREKLCKKSQKEDGDTDMNSLSKSPVVATTAIDTKNRVRRGAALKATKAIADLVSKTPSSPSQRAHDVNCDDESENNTVSMSLSDKSTDSNDARHDHGTASKTTGTLKSTAKSSAQKAGAETAMTVIKKRIGGVLRKDVANTGNKNNNKKKKKVIAFADAMENQKDDNSTVGNKSQTSTSTSATATSYKNQTTKEQSQQDDDYCSNNDDWRVSTAVDY